MTLGELERLAKAATPGPWKCPRFLGQPQLYVYKAHGADIQVARALSELRPDAAFIAAANPATVLLMVEALRAAEKMREGSTSKTRRDFDAALGKLEQTK
jgi:tagatose-1,6-bisphosphate aldolase non-catalytic subunit AgaZ/GatZ